MAESKSYPFPHPELTALATDARPTFVSLQLLHAELQSNAESVPSVRGNGALGHLAITMTPAAFLLESGNIPFNPPVHPGAAPNHPPAATAPIITEINRQFLADQHEFAVYTDVGFHLKRQLLKAVPALYLDKLRHPTRHFARHTVLELLAHLDTTYGKLTTDDLAINRKNLHREWSSAQTLESLWSNIDRCRQIALELNPISDMDAVQAALDNLERTGVFTDAIKLWRHRPSEERTYDNMQEHFNLADLERQRELTAKSAGYHGASFVTGTPVPTGHAALATESSTPSALPKYCWTHGCGTFTLGHSSSDCTRRSKGHMPDATFLNMLGGNNTIRRLNGEQPIYKPPKPRAAAVVPPTSAPPAPVATTPPVAN
jgi:hypothetical protein